MKQVTEPTRESAVAKMYAAGLKSLYRPNDPGDTYHSTEAVKAWAERQADALIAKGVIKVTASA